MLFLVSLASSAALLAPGRGGRGVPRLLESSTTARPPPLMNQAPTGPAGEAAKAGSAVKRWLASRCLPTAVLYGNAGFGKALIKAGADLETMPGNEYTPLHYAVVSGNVGLVEALAEAGASLETVGKSSTGSTPLQLAICKGNVEVVKVLIKAGASLEDRNVIGCEHLDVIKALIEAGASLEAVDGVTALQFAITQEAGASLERAAVGGFTPLQLAICVGNVDTIKASIETKASLEAACGFESTPLQQGVSNGILPSATPDGNLDAIKMLVSLVEAGASLGVACELDLTALQFAICLGNVDVIKTLIQASGSLGASEDGSEFTAMDDAIETENNVVIEALIEAGASLDGPGGNEPTLLQRAIIKGNVYTIKLLIEAGASLEGMSAGDFTSTPLQLAIYLGNVDAVEALLEAGASFEPVNEDELTPREFAAKLLAKDKGNADVLKALVDAEAAREEARDMALRAIRDALE